MNSLQSALSVPWQTAGWTMLHFLWIGGLFALGASFVLRAVRDRSPETRYALAVSQFFILALIPPCLFVWKVNHPAVAERNEGVIASDVNVAAAGAPPTEVEARAADSPVAPSRAELNGADVANIPVLDRPLAQSPPRSALTVIPVAADPVSPPSPGLLRRVTAVAQAGAEGIVNLLPWVWVAGFPLMCLSLLTGIAGAERFRRQCRNLDDDRVIAACRRLQQVLRVPGNVALGVSSHISAPILVGIVRPLILLPASMLAGLTTAQLEMVLLHELAHVRRWDNLVNLLQRIVEAVLFFHPAIWWLSARVRLEREHCCDAVVLAQVSGPEEYAEVLVQFALQMPKQEIALGTSMSQQLIPRIRRILKQEDERMQVSRSLVTVTLSVILSLAVLTVASAQRKPTDKPIDKPAASTKAEPRANPGPGKANAQLPEARKPLTAEERASSISIQGTVLEKDGRPARWSEVWLLGFIQLPGNRFGATQIEAGRADVNGKFEFRHPRWREHNPGPEAYPLLWVVGRTRDGVLTRTRELNLAGEYRDQTQIQNLELKVLPRVNYSGRILGGDGKPIDKAEVTPEFLVLPPLKGERMATMSWHAELSAEYRVTTDADGKFTLIGLPESLNIQARITASGIGTRVMFWKTNPEPELVLQPGGTIRGMLKNPPSEEFCSQIELELSSVSSPRVEDAEATVIFGTRIKPDADGSFEIADVPPGLYHLRASPVRGGFSMPPEFTIPVSCSVESAETTDDIEIAFPKAIVAHGTVVDEETGEGVAGAAVNFFEDGGNARNWRGMATTNANGEYRAYLLPGKIAVEHRQAPDGYLTPLHDRQSRSEMHEDDFEAPTLRLERAAKLRGTVVDEEGRPLARSEIRWIYPPRVGNRELNPLIETDESGEFVIPQIDPHDSLPLRVRHTSGVSKAITVQQAALATSQKIIVSPRNAFRIKGTLIDQGGRPVSGATVAVHWHRSYVSKRTQFSGTYGEFEKCDTDEQGRFEFANLWADDGYHIVINAEGFSKIDLRKVEGRPGEVHDYGSVRLTGASQSISGQVLDDAGKPVADATVFNSGDATQVVQTLTDKEGRFRLEGLLTGPAWIFVEHHDFRFFGTHVKGASEELSLQLTPRSAPALRRPAVDFEGLETVRRQKTAELQAWLNTSGFTMRPNLRDSRFAALALTDPEEALQQIAKQSPGMDYRSAVLLARQLTPFQPRKQPLNAQDKKNVEAALKFVDRVVSRIDDIDATRRLFARAEAGLMYLRLGNRERGLPLVEAAEKEWSASPPPADNPYSFTIVTIAQGLARTDVSRALGYVERVSDEHLKSNIRNRVILEVARFDVPRALALLKDPKYAPSRDVIDDTLKFELAWHIAKVDPQQAAKLVGSIGNSRTKAEACGWTAVAIGDEAPELAKSLIDQGFGTLQSTRTSSPNSLYYEYIPGVAAHLALQASQVKHPETESLIHRALALRIPADPNTSTTSRLQSTVNAALFLGFVDPGAARQLLVDLEPALPGELLGNGGSGSVGRREWYYAWVVADPGHAVELLQADLKRGADPKTNPAAQWVQDAFTFLALPEPERLNYALTYHLGNLSKPYDE